MKYRHKSIERTIHILVHATIYALAVAFLQSAVVGMSALADPAEAVHDYGAGNEQQRSVGDLPSPSLEDTYLERARPAGRKKKDEGKPKVLPQEPPKMTAPKQ